MSSGRCLNKTDLYTKIDSIQKADIGTKALFYDSDNDELYEKDVVMWANVHYLFIDAVFKEKYDHSEVIGMTHNDLGDPELYVINDSENFIMYLLPGKDKSDYWDIINEYVKENHKKEKE